MITLDGFFGSHSESRHLFDVLLCSVQDISPTEIRVTKSQIAFHRNRIFAWAWMPGKYLHGKVAPLVLTIPFPKQDPSQRWKEIVEPAPGRFMHLLELISIEENDSEVIEWLRCA